MAGGSAQASRRFVLLCGLAPAILVAALVIFRPAFLVQLDLRAYDALLGAGRPAARHPRVLIVDIDDQSLASIGQWPWRRDIVGRLIARLRDSGAAVIALDVVFAEADRFDAGSGAGRSPDAALASALAPGRVVLGYALTFTPPAANPRPCVLHPLGVALVQRDSGADAPLFYASGAICSLPVLARAAGASGFLNAVPDSDGILRRVPLVLEYGGSIYPGLALSAVLAATGGRAVAIEGTNPNASTLRLDSGSVPLDGKGNLLVRYRGGKQTFPYVSAADVLQGRHAPDQFKDAIVFVGTTALGTREVVSTPLDTRFAGVEVQATVADNLLQRDFLSRAENAVTLEVVAVLIAAIAITLIVARVGLPLGSAAAVLLLLAAWTAAWWLLAARGNYLSPLFPALAMVASLAAATLARIAQERQRADTAGRETDVARRLMVKSLLSLTEMRDADTGRHSRRIQHYSRLVAESLASYPAFRDYLTPERIELLSTLAPLHDIGKVGVPDQLLNKPGALTAEEFQEMKKHPAYGLDVITNAQRDVGVGDDLVLSMAKEIVYTHHEWWDGNGYPRGIKGDSIPIAGRVVAIVDVYDALTARRLYRQPIPHDEAVQIITSRRGTHFDPAVVDAFVRIAPALRDSGGRLPGGGAVAGS